MKNFGETMDDNMVSEILKAKKRLQGINKKLQMRNPLRLAKFQTGIWYLSRVMQPIIPERAFRIG